MVPAPTGTVTLLFTDIEGSTRLWEARHDAMERAMAIHDELCREIIQHWRGYLPVSQGEGDSLVGSFASATDAVRCAAALQRALVAAPWEDGVALRVRMAVHTGEVGLKDGDYFGIAMNRCARLRALGSGSQVLLSLATAGLVRDEIGPELELRDLGLHRLRDLTQPEHVFELRWPGSPPRYPPLRSLDAAAHNLPIQLTSFVGREREVDDVTALVGANRIVTLTGSGGCGKTRLALQVGADLADEFGDGVWLVELAPLGDGTLVARQFAEALGVLEEPGRPVLDTVVDWLRDRSVLLVVDNCEHVVDDAARIVDVVVRSTPRVHVLATGREALGVGGEVPVRVPSLSVPSEGSDQARADAVRLFLDRAAAFGSGHAAPDTARLDAVAHICRRLDGIPLAIELAAARTRVLSPAQIADRLGDRFRLLTGGSRTALPRQQTLRATVDWSHDLLDEREQAVLRRLAVFSGGCRLDAAEAVVATTAIAEADVVDLLASLHDKSLLEVVRDRDDVPRYRVLETVREYGAEKLLAANESDATRRRHLEWCRALASEAAARLDAGGGVATEPWLERLDEEHDNFRAALGWAIGSGAEGAALALACDLYSFWWMRGHLDEGGAWFAVLLDATSEEVSPGLRARALRAGSLFALFQGRRERAEGMARESLELARDVGDVELECSALRMLANHSEFDDTGLAHLEEAVQLAAAEGHELALTYARRSLGLALALHGAHDRAAAILDEALDFPSPDAATRAWVLEAAGAAALERGDLDRARELSALALETARRSGAAWPAASAKAALATVARGQGDLDAAGVLAGEALEELRAVGDEQRAALVFVELATIACARGDGEAAKAWLDEACTPARQQWRRVQAGVARVRADLLVAVDDADGAREQQRVADALLRELGYRHS